MSLACEKESFFKDRNHPEDYDKLTEVYNRKVMEEYIQSLVDVDRAFAMMLCDIDNFSDLNDSYGNETGDNILKGLAKSLNRIAGEYAVIGRFDGDRFYIIIPDADDYDDVWTKCKLITASINGKANEDFGEITVSVTIGLSRFPLDARGAESLLLTCKKALYRGKQKGRNCFIIYLPEKHADIDIGEIVNVEKHEASVYAKIAHMLTQSEDLVENIVQLNQFLGNSLMVDHICLESEKYILSENVHKLSVVKTFKHIATEGIDKLANDYGLVFYKNTEEIKASGNDEVSASLLEQGVTAVLYSSVEAYGEKYGYIRAESTQPDGRSWQERDKDIFVIYARMLGLIIHSRGIDMNKLFLGNLV